MSRFSTGLMYAYVAIVAYTLGVGGIILGLNALIQPARAAQVAESKPVNFKPMKKASKSQKVVDQLAALTPGSDVHDWVGVLDAGKAGAK